MPLGQIDFPSREAASAAAAGYVAEALRADVAAFGRASLLVSGGSTPAAMFSLLAAEERIWPDVTVGLVDERWVPPDHPESNERLVRSCLLQGPAASAGFVPMKTPATEAAAAEADRDAAYAPLCKPASMLVLGMGEDGHTASWFPGSDELEQVVSPSQARNVAAVQAPGAAIAQRMTLTGPAIARARGALLLVFGAEKRRVLAEARTSDPLKFPVRFAIDALGSRLSVFWAP